MANSQLPTANAQPGEARERAESAEQGTSRRHEDTEEDTSLGLSSA